MHDTTKVKRVVCLTGKLYYDLVREREQRGPSVVDTIAFVRIEELSPFPLKQLQHILKTRYSTAEEIVWLQEEPRNQGAFSYVEPWVQAAWRNSGKETAVRYVGRKADAVPAPGVVKLYGAQQKRVIDEVLEGL